MVSGVRASVNAAAARLHGATAAVDALSGAAENIRLAVSVHLNAAAQIERSAQDAAVGAEDIGARIGHVANAAQGARTLSEQVRDAARLLSENVRTLCASTVSFVAHLRQGETSIALAA